jgi:hypothetical protein
MAKKPNYDFEKRERERLKNEKKKARALERAQSSPSAETPQDGPQDAASDES